MKKIYIAILLAGLLMAGTAGFSSAMTADEVLDKMDQTMEHSNQVAVLSMTLTDKKGIVQNREIKMFQKEGGKRLIKFLKPADVKGTGFLSLPGDEMYIYMPALGKVRRIASHVKNQSFMGTDFSYDDMGGEQYSGSSKTTSFTEEGGKYLIEVTAAKKDATYSRLKLIIDKNTFIADKIEFFDKAGKPFKTMTNSNVEKIGDSWVSKEIKMVNVQEGHTTVLKMTDISFDSELSDDIFTQRNLQK